MCRWKGFTFRSYVSVRGISFADEGPHVENPVNQKLVKSLVVYRLVHPPVTRESGVRLPARETLFFFLFSSRSMLWKKKTGPRFKFKFWQV